MAPDVFVVLGADNADRSTYRLWVEPKAPDFVLEITSRSTRREDQVSKRALYRSLGVREYWQFDPTNDYLEPPLQGLELIEGEYRPLPALASAVLGLELRLTERGLRFHDPQTGEDLSNLGEIDAARQRAEQKRKKRSHALRRKPQPVGRRQQPDRPRRRAWRSSRTCCANPAAAIPAATADQRARPLPKPLDGLDERQDTKRT